MVIVVVAAVVTVVGTTNTNQHNYYIQYMYLLHNYPYMNLLHKYLQRCSHISFIYETISNANNEIDYCELTHTSYEINV
jgi:hypothetical protein